MSCCLVARGRSLVAGLAVVVGIVGTMRTSCCSVVGVAVVGTGTVVVAVVAASIRLVSTKSCTQGRQIRKDATYVRLRIRLPK